jgi:hypothetical protein
MKAVRDEQTRERVDHVAFMKNPKRWPRWPLLALKKPGNMALATPGFIIAGESPPVVYKRAIYALTGPTVCDLRREIPPEPQEPYVDHAAIFDAGWRVD